jgi:hypothetical protein
MGAFDKAKKETQAAVVTFDELKKGAEQAIL